MIAERKRILKMVEEGKLTVEEALTLLGGLDDANKANVKKGSSSQEVSTNVFFEEAKKEDPFNQTFHSVKDKLIDFVDTVYQKIKDTDLDFNFGHSYEIDHVFQQNDVEIKDVDIDLANGSLKVIPWDEKNVRIDCGAKVYRVGSQDEARVSFLQDVTFDLCGDKLRFATQQKWMKLDATLYIPRTQYEHVKIRLFNGSIDAQSIEAKSYRAKTANGKITLQDITCKDGEVETANGKVTIQRGKMDRLEVETINGSIAIDGDYHDIGLQSFNGDVVCQLSSETCKYLEAKVATGSVEVHIPEHMAVNGDLKTNLGSLNVHLDRIQVVSEKSDVLQKSMYFKSAQDEGNVMELKAETKTGSISVKKAKSVSF